MSATDLKPFVELIADFAMWRQKAHDLENERDYLRKRVTELETLLTPRSSDREEGGDK